MPTTTATVNANVPRIDSAARNVPTSPFPP
jgi:hypothetical protein